MPAGQLTSATKPSIRAVVDAVYDIAKNKSGITWGASKEWDMPLAGEITAYPYLVVMRPEFAGYLDGAGRLAGKTLRRSIGSVKKAHDIGVYAIYPFEPANQNTYTTPQDAADLLENAFIIYYGLEKVAGVYSSDISEPMAGPLHIGSQYGSLDPGIKFWSVSLTVRAYLEILTVN